MAKKTLASGQPATFSYVLEIDARFQAWLTAIEDAGGEVTPELEAELNAIQADKRERMEQFAKIRRFAKAMSAVAANEAARAAAYKARMDALADKVDSWAMVILKDEPDKKMQVGTTKWVVTRNSQPSVTCADIDSLPDEFVIEETTRKLNRERVLAEAEFGALPAGVTVTRGEHVRVYP